VRSRQLLRHICHACCMNIAGWAFAKSHNNAGLSARCEVHPLVLLQIQVFLVNISSVHSTVNMSPSRDYSWLRSALFWHCTQRMVVIPYRRILDLSTLGGGPIGCPETSVRNYHLRYVLSQKSADLIIFAAGAWNRAFLTHFQKNSGLINP